MDELKELINTEIRIIEDIDEKLVTNEPYISDNDSLIESLSKYIKQHKNICMNII